jgi:hypothetical protein
VNAKEFKLIVKQRQLSNKEGASPHTTLTTPNEDDLDNILDAVGVRQTLGARRFSSRKVSA